MAICDGSSFDMLRTNKCFNTYFEVVENRSIFHISDIKEPDRIIKGLEKRRRFKIVLSSNSKSREKLSIGINIYFKDIQSASYLVVSAVGASYEEEVNALLSSAQSALEVKNSKLERAVEKAETLAKTKANFFGRNVS